MLIISEMAEGDMTERRDDNDMRKVIIFRRCGGTFYDRSALDGLCMGHCETSPPDTATLSPVPNAGGGCALTLPCCLLCKPVGS